MAEPVRLFLFAGYDKDNIVADSLVYYVKTLSKYGDVIVCIDNDLPQTEIQKIKPFAIHTIAQRHGEYDFGSYKRAYQYARDKKILKIYKVFSGFHHKSGTSTSNSVNLSSCLVGNRLENAKGTVKRNSFLVQTKYCFGFSNAQGCARIGTNTSKKIACGGAV